MNINHEDNINNYTPEEINLKKSIKCQHIFNLQAVSFGKHHNDVSSAVGIIYVSINFHVLIS